MFNLRPVLKLLALLVFFVPSLSVFAQQDEEGNDSLLMSNFIALREEGQGFYLKEFSYLLEKPDSVEGSFVTLNWWCDLKFSSDDATNNYGYVGRGVQYILGSSLGDAVAQGAQLSSNEKHALSVSAVLVPTLGIFEGQIHKTQDDLVHRYWDDGNSTLQLLAWEGHDEGDTHPNSETAAWSGSGTLTKITTEVAAELLGMDVVDMTPATCSMEYEAAWNATHVPDPINELLARIVAIEESLTEYGSGSGDDGEATAKSSSSPFMAVIEHATMDIVMKSIVTVAVIIGLVVN